MTAAPQHFEPEAQPLWYDPGLTLAGIALATPALFWWRGWSWSLALGLIPAAWVLALVRWLFERRHQGALTLSDAGVRVSTRAGVFEVGWNEIHRVHRFKDRLVFETSAPHRRHTLTLDGHDAHRREMLAALKTFGKVLNLTWVDTLGDVLD